jgi:glycosyltransferase involved in cell wall biosynthesis
MDSSGYAEAARNHIAALDSVGVKVEVKPVSFEGYRSDLGKLGAIVQSKVKNNPKNKIQILHLTPQNYSKFIGSNNYNIGYCAWETSLLPEPWVPMINALDEVWVPCEHNIQCFKDSGITVPVYCMPHPFDVQYTDQVDQANAVVANREPDELLFYSIFQWTERKNPLGLLKAYLTEFKKNEQVALVLKTYLMNPGSPKEVDNLKKHIIGIKSKLYQKEFPKLLLITSLLSRGQIQSLHREGNCYVSLHRCEGFGIPIAEAMLAGNPTIATNYGGPADFLTEETGYPVDYMMTPCYGMPWGIYTGNMLWAEPDIMDARAKMRSLFENRKRATAIGRQGQKFIQQNFSWEKMGLCMKKRLEAIEAKL